MLHKRVVHHARGKTVLGNYIPPFALSKPALQCFSLANLQASKSKDVSHALQYTGDCELFASVSKEVHHPHTTSDQHSASCDTLFLTLDRASTEGQIRASRVRGQATASRHYDVRCYSKPQLFACMARWTLQEKPVRAFFSSLVIRSRVSRPRARQIPSGRARDPCRKDREKDGLEDESRSKGKE